MIDFLFAEIPLYVLLCAALVFKESINCEEKGRYQESFLCQEKITFQ